jgi:DNA-binding MarR family transcriptional regulator
MAAARRNRETVTESMDAFRRIVHALRSSHRAAADRNLTGAQLFVLSTLGAAGEPMGVKELAARTRTDQSTVSVVVGRLVERGLVDRARSTVDTRRVELSLTARGKMLQRKTPTTVAQQKLADALWHLSAADAATLSRILKGIVETMGESDAPAPMLFDENTEEEQTKTRQRRPATKKARARAVRR